VTEERIRDIEDILEQARLCVKVGDATDLEVAMLDGGRELLTALKESQDNPTRVCPGCGRTIGLVIGDHTYKGGMPLCHEAHVRASLLEEAERRAEVAEAALKEAREELQRSRGRVQAVSACYDSAAQRVEAAEAQAAQAREEIKAFRALGREEGYLQGIYACMGKIARSPLFTDRGAEAKRQVFLLAKRELKELLPAPETPAGVEEIGETCNETDGNRPFVWVMEAGEYRLIHGEEGEG
jgi:hypothetical protein